MEIWRVDGHQRCDIDARSTEHTVSSAVRSIPCVRGVPSTIPVPLVFVDTTTALGD